MELHNEKYTVTSDVAVNPPLDQFDIIHNTEKINTHDFCMAYTFQITRNDGHILNMALIDLICSSYIPYAVLDGKSLVVILFKSILRLDMDTGAIIQYEKCDNIGGLFEIHRIHDGYLIWGEGNIFRYDDSLTQIWNFAGRDILISLQADKHFWIEDDRIHCRDFLGWHYVLDFDGNLIIDHCEFESIKTL